jgi:hypothetical protein
MVIHILSNLYNRTLSDLVSSEHVSIMSAELVNESIRKCGSTYTEMTASGPQFISKREQNFHCARLAEHQKSLERAKQAAKSAVELVALGMFIIKGLSYLTPTKQLTAGEQIKLAQKFAVSIYLDSTRPKHSPDTLAERNPS